MRTPSLFAPLFLCLAAGAQPQQVKIANAAALDAAGSVHKHKSAQAALMANGITAEQMDQVITYGDREHWPAGIKVDSLREKNRPYIQNYACFRVAGFTEDSVPKTVIMVPARENIHMPEVMRPLSDLYMIVPDSAIANVQPGKPRPEISRGPKWKNLPAARIVKPEELYGTYDLGHDSTALKVLQDKGLSQPEIDAVIFRSTDRNWPDGIDSFEERQKLLPNFKKYKAFLGAKWDDKVLLIVPVEKNRKAPVLMRPFVDLYLVYNASAVEVKKK